MVLVVKNTQLGLLQLNCQIIHEFLYYSEVVINMIQFKFSVKIGVSLVFEKFSNVLAVSLA